MSALHNIAPLEIFSRHANETPNKVYLRQPIKGEIKNYTWSDSYEQTLRLAQGLLSMGLNKGDKVAILANNCAEWFISDYALSAAGLISAPIYSTAGESVIDYVLKHCDAKAIIVGDIAKPEFAKNAIPSDVITIGMSTSTLDWQYNVTDLISDNSPLEDIHQPNMDETFSIVYTSGSTGAPKGVVLTYENACFTGSTAAGLCRQGSNERFLSYLPLAHVAERALVQYTSLYVGATVTFNESIETFIDDLRSAEVTSFFSVPRLWIKFQSQVLANMPQRKLSLLLSIPVVGTIVKNKIKAQLGFSNCGLFGSGSAPISPSILDWYHKLGIDISEGWGLSETFGLATTNYPFQANKLGTIGHAFDGFDVKISEQGEVLIKGGGVFKEYFKNPETTAETFTEDGYMRTGDKADIDNDGFLTITGRVKDLFKTAKGKYIAPVPIESKLAANILIEQLCVMGNGLPKAMVAIVLSEEVAKDMSKEEISQSLIDTITEVNDQIEKHEAIGGAMIVAEPWTINNSLLTPTMKIKRDVLEDKYLPLFEKQTDDVFWQ